MSHHSESFLDNSDISSLIKANVRLSAIISKFEINLKKTNKTRLTTSHLEVRAELLSGYWKTFEETDQKIMANLETEEEATVDYCIQNTYDKTEELYMNASTFIKEKLVELCPPPVPLAAIASTSTNITATTIGQPHVPRIKLPTIPIPSFDGTYESWPTFHSMYKSLIHDEPALAPVHKLHYLKSSLHGEAAHLLRHFQLTALNYEPAWDMLIQRYENKRVLVNNQLKRLFNQSRLTNDNSQGLKLLRDTTVEIVQSLNNVGIDTTNWDAILNYLIVQRLTTETHLLWEQSLEDSRDIPSFQQLISFLEMRYRSLEMVSSKPIASSNVPRNNAVRKSQTFHNSATTSIKCILCSKDHSIRQCEEFFKLSPTDRSKQVSTKNVCSNCLSSKHLNSKCPSKHRCLKCKQRHHTLLHPNSEPNSTSNSTINSTSNITPNAASNSVSIPRASTSTVNSFHVHNTSGHILLATAIVRVTSESGTDLLLRALLDQGSQSSFISESAVQKLGLRKEKVFASISGIGEGCTTTNS